MYSHVRISFPACNRHVWGLFRLSGAGPALLASERKTMGTWPPYLSRLQWPNIFVCFAVVAIQISSHVAYLHISSASFRFFSLAVLASFIRLPHFGLFFISCYCFVYSIASLISRGFPFLFCFFFYFDKPCWYSFFFRPLFFLPFIYYFGNLFSSHSSLFLSQYR